MPLPVDGTKLATQADYFARTMESCLAVEACVFYTVWGFTDAHSWVPGWFQGEGAATPLDEAYRPKPAYFALRDALRS
jgi:endo-1,4-beta-xylanase